MLGAGKVMSIPSIWSRCEILLNFSIVWDFPIYGNQALTIFLLVLFCVVDEPTSPPKGLRPLPSQPKVRSQSLC